jgi:hypothetical protein
MGVLVLFVCAAACSKAEDDGIAPDPAWAAATCKTGTHLVESACVDDAFDQVVIPAPGTLPPVDLDGDGSQYLHGILFVGLKDAATTPAAAAALLAKHGGTVIGSIPFAGLYHARFDDAGTGALLAAKQAAIEADPAVAFVARDSVADRFANEWVRKKDTAIETLEPTALFWDIDNAALPAAIGPNGKWPYKRIGLFEAWDAIYARNPRMWKVIVGILDGRVGFEGEVFENLALPGMTDYRVHTFEGDPPRAARHGTAVASIIGAPDKNQHQASTGNNQGTTGILAGLPCIRYDLSPMFVIADKTMCAKDDDCGSPTLKCVLAPDKINKICDAKQCSKDEDCGAANQRCLKPEGESAATCHIDCSNAATEEARNALCPVPPAYVSSRSYKCGDVKVEGVTQQLCVPRVKPTVASTNAIFYGMVQAVKSGARVVNMSLGRRFESERTDQQQRDEEQAAMEREHAGLRRVVRAIAAKAPQTLFVIAAGNDDTDAAMNWPGSVTRADEANDTPPNILCVAATDASDKRARWQEADPKTGAIVQASNFDKSTPTVTIAAPGSQELAQLPDGKLTMFSGTSGAAPLVSGAAGLLFAILPGLDGANAKRILTATATPIKDATISGRLLNIAGAVNKAMDIEDAIVPEAKGQGECREKDKPPVEPPPDGDNACKIGALCDYCETPQVGSAWLGEVMVIWGTETVLNQFDVDAYNPTTKEDVEFVITFMGQGADAKTMQKTSLSVTHNRITGTAELDPESSAFPLGTYKSPDGVSSPIESAGISLTFSGTHVKGTLQVKTKKGGATIDITGCFCPCV